MKISAVSSNISKNLQIKNNNSQTVQKRENINYAQNPISNVYPKKYYLSFKGTEKSEEIENFEMFLDELYKKNKNRATKSMSDSHIFCDGNKTQSRFINDDFEKMIKNKIEYNKAPNIDEQRLTKVIQDCIQAVESDETPENLIKKLKENKTVPENISIKANDNCLTDILCELEDELIENRPGLHEYKIHSYYHEIVETFNQSLKQYNEPVFDEKLLECMKAELKEEPFKSFNEKVLKIKAQEKINNSPSPEQFAEDLYNDTIEKKIAPFDNPKFYNYLSLNDEKLDFLLEQIYGYGDTEYRNLFEKSGFDKRQKVLLADPGTASHFEELVEYVNKNNINTKEIEPYQLRKGFSDYLGTETVYRGLYDDAPEILAAKLKRDGNYASIFKNKDEAVNAIKYYISPSPEYYSTLRGKMSDRIKKLTNTEILSVSSLPDIAVSVPKLWGETESPVVLIKAEVPKLSLIKQERRFKNVQYGAEGKSLCVGKNKYSYDKEQSKIEAFMLFYLPVNNFEITIDTTTPGFVWE